MESCRCKNMCVSTLMQQGIAEVQLAHGPALNTTHPSAAVTIVWALEGGEIVPLGRTPADVSAYCTASTVNTAIFCVSLSARLHDHESMGTVTLAAVKVGDSTLTCVAGSSPVSSADGDVLLTTTGVPPEAGVAVYTNCRARTQWAHTNQK